MPMVCYQPCNFRPRSLLLIDQANAIIDRYQADGYDLTLRQLYYQLVSADVIPNNQREYDNLGGLISNARRAGLIDWDAIVDRTRNLRRLDTWDHPREIVDTAARAFRRDLWADQPRYVEVWFEKDALSGVFERVCDQLRVPFFACRGYPSDSEVWGAARRLEGAAQTDGGDDLRDITILHFGDHDPSGIDMTRDITDRLALFEAPDLEVRRIALNMDQIRRYKPPPNPAKQTDSRFIGYAALYGNKSWELDALPPTTLAQLVKTNVDAMIDQKRWVTAVNREKRSRQALAKIATNFDAVAKAQGVRGAL